MKKLIDIHCHLDFKNFNKDREEVINRAKKKLTAVINSGASYEGNKKTLKLSKEYEGFIYPTLGFHPTNNEPIDRTIEEIEKNVEYIVGIGEVGMDFYRVEDPEERKRQEHIFKKFIELSNEYELPLVIHARECEDRVFEIVKELKDDSNVVFHCYSGSVELAKKILEEGYYISVPTLVCFSKHHQNIVKNLPLEKILTETDSPFLSPYRGKRNEPSFVEEAVKKIAELKSMSIEKVDEITDRNARKVFNIG